MKGCVKVGKEDNIIFSKLWQDNDVIALKAVCSSPVATITTKIYVSNPLIDELIGQIEPFLHGDVEEGLWANEDRGNDSTACLSLRFLRKEKEPPRRLPAARILCLKFL